jgi:hypothetical protein
VEDYREIVFFSTLGNFLIFGRHASLDAALFATKVTCRSYGSIHRIVLIPAIHRIPLEDCRKVFFLYFVHCSIPGSGGKRSSETFIDFDKRRDEFFCRGPGSSCVTDVTQG